MPKHLLLLLLLLLAGGCRRAPQPAPATIAGVYYWRTTLNMTEKERAWLKEHHIRRLYLRLFDVVLSDSPTSGGTPAAMPNATLRFDQPLPEGVEIIPTIFITADVFRHTTGVDDLATLVARRIQQMSQTHGFSYSEIQIDCDWTATTREPYFRFLRSLRTAHASTAAQPASPHLSATIRLHQLTQPAPPVDSGVLMVYNTGDYRAADTDHNPIIDWRDVQPYVKHLADYTLPLTAAYPNFRWQLLFAGPEFKGILYGIDLSDRSLFTPTSATTYRVEQAREITMSMGGSTLRLLPGETVRVWTVDADALRRIQDELERTRPGINKDAILYCLDETNL